MHCGFKMIQSVFPISTKQLEIQPVSPGLQKQVSESIARSAAAATFRYMHIHIQPQRMYEKLSYPKNDLSYFVKSFIMVRQVQNFIFQLHSRIKSVFV